MQAIEHKKTGWWKEDMTTGSNQRGGGAQGGMHVGRPRCLQHDAQIQLRSVSEVVEGIRAVAVAAIRVAPCGPYRHVATHVDGEAWRHSISGMVEGAEPIPPKLPNWWLRALKCCAL